MYKETENFASLVKLWFSYSQTKLVVLFDIYGAFRYVYQYQYLHETMIVWQQRLNRADQLHIMQLFIVQNGSKKTAIST